MGEFLNENKRRQFYLICSSRSMQSFERERKKSSSFFSQPLTQKITSSCAFLRRSLGKRFPFESTHRARAQASIHRCFSLAVALRFHSERTSSIRRRSILISRSFGQVSMLCRRFLISRSLCSSPITVHRTDEIRFN